MRYPRTSLFFLITFASLASWGCAPATVGQRVPGIDNFAAVEGAPKKIYRGGQPTREGYARLAKGDLKVATVIDLRDDAEPWAESAVTSQGMAYKRIPTNAGKVEKAKIREFLEAITTATGPVFVHCRAGRDRTGLEIAMYRILVQGWDRATAITELNAHGYNRFWFPGLERFLRTFDVGELKDAVSTTAATDQARAAAMGTSR